jgi:hypothetical protein
MAATAHELLTIDNTTGHIQTSSKPLSDTGELELTFDKWHQAWHHLLDLIRTFIPNEFLMWQIHHFFIINNKNRSELWPVYLAYDAEIVRGLHSCPSINLFFQSVSGTTWKQDIPPRRFFPWSRPI